MGRTGSSHMGLAADKCKEKPKNWYLHHAQMCLRCRQGARPRRHTAVQGAMQRGAALFAARSWRKEIIRPRPSSHRAMPLPDQGAG